MRTQQWVDAWNEKDVAGMRRLHAADVADQRYVIGNGFTTMEWLLKELRETNFWKATWLIRMADAKVRMLAADAGRPPDRWPPTSNDVCDAALVGYAYEATVLGLESGMYHVEVFHRNNGGESAKLAARGDVTVP